MVIDAKKLEQEIAQFMPVVNWGVGLMPGTAGINLLAFLKGITAPGVIEPAVNLINQILAANAAVASNIGNGGDAIV